MYFTVNLDFTGLAVTFVALSTLAIHWYYDYILISIWISIIKKS